MYQAPAENGEWTNWGSTVARMGFAVASTAAACFGVYGDLIRFRLACGEYFEMFPLPSMENEGLTWFFF